MKNWYYLENGVQRGPVTEQELPALFQIGTIGPDTYLWSEGMPEWKKHNELLAAPAPATQLAPIVAVASPPPVRAAVAPAPSETIQACSQCGAEVPSSQIMRIGSAALCPKCQTGYRRQAQYGFEERPNEYASPIVRLIAYILDGILCSLGAAILLVAAWIFVPRFFPDNHRVLIASSVGAIVCAVVWFLDYFIGRIAREGATPAMKLFHIKVINASGEAPGFWRALARFLMILVTNSLTFSLGHLIAFFDKQRRSLHDIVCGTVVVKK